MNTFANFLPHEAPKFNYKTSEWMNKSIFLSLKKRLKLAKIYYNNIFEEGLIDQANKYQLILEVKEQNIATMIAKIDDPKMAPKTY